MLRKRAAQPAWWAAYQPYWQSLPPVGGVYTKECWRPEHLAPLQDAALVRPTLLQYSQTSNGSTLFSAPDCIIRSGGRHWHFCRSGGRCRPWAACIPRGASARSTWPRRMRQWCA